MWMVQSCVCTGWIINKLNLNQTRSRAVYAECMVSTRLQVFSWTGPTLPLLTQRQSRGTMRTSVPLAYIPHLVCYNFSSISILWANIKDIVQFVQLKQSYHLFKSHCPWGDAKPPYKALARLKRQKLPPQWVPLPMSQKLCYFWGFSRIRVLWCSHGSSVHWCFHIQHILLLSRELAAKVKGVYHG